MKATLCAYPDARFGSRDIDEYYHRELLFDEAAVLTELGIELRDSFCIYCNGRLRWGVLTVQSREGVSRIESPTVDYCEQCGFWHTRELRYLEAIGEEDVCYFIGQVRHYDIASKEIPIDALRRFLVKHPRHLAHIHPTAFELLMRDCIRDAYAPCEVIHIGGTADGGIDLKLVTSDQDTFLIQVKRRGNLGRKESVRVVRELNGVLFRENAAKGMVITTASAFTRNAVAETHVRTPTKHTYYVQLLAFDDVVTMLHVPRTETNQPWMRHNLDGVLSTRWMGWRKG
jgi:hypothetical protein